ncbi:hypothetical protein A3843_02975 [Pseudovibrio exalbescens]|uniref:FAD dependent oxidoreductase domain-containing protein n=1 Tax=Pseudovibrio exalbescens TaxID=197461 RepID=A0A1U7JKT1_9HYPH|nr:hypothetical protein A3843_02975 [Pseudovibrio exalbescens]
MRSEHIRSFYAARLASRVTHAELVGAQHTQAGVVGGGLAGLTAAVELASRGVSVVLLEAERIGWGASGRNGGFVSAGFAEGIDGIEKAVGIDAARRLYKLSQEGVSYIRRTLDEEGAGDLIEGGGWLKVQRYPGERQLAERRDKMARDYGVELELFNREQVQHYLNSERYHHALFNSEPFHIDPLAYSEVLRRKLVALGGTIHEETEVSGIKKNGASWRIHASHGCVSCEHVVVATSAYGVVNGTYLPVDRTMQPVATYVVTSAVMPERLKHVIRFNGCIADTRRAGDYYRLVDEGRRLLWGGRITTRRSEPRHLARLLKSQILEIYPDLGDFPVEHAWSGLMGYSRNRMPLIGQLKPGLWAATAFGGHGLNTSAMGGLLVARAIAERDDTWEAFKSFGPVWAGGVAGRAAVQTEYLRLQLLDRLEERRVPS